METGRRSGPFLLEPVHDLEKRGRYSRKKTRHAGMTSFFFEIVNGFLGYPGNGCGMHAFDRFPLSAGGQRVPKSLPPRRRGG